MPPHTYFSQRGDVAQVSLLKQCLVVLRVAVRSAHGALCDRFGSVKYHIVWQKNKAKLAVSSIFTSVNLSVIPKTSSIWKTAIGSNSSLFNSYPWTNHTDTQTQGQTKISLCYFIIYI